MRGFPITSWLFPLHLSKVSLSLWVSRGRNNPETRGVRPTKDFLLILLIYLLSLFTSVWVPSGRASFWGILTASVFLFLNLVGSAPWGYVSGSYRYLIMLPYFRGGNIEVGGLCWASMWSFVCGTCLCYSCWCFSYTFFFHFGDEWFDSLQVTVVSLRPTERNEEALRVPTPSFHEVAIAGERQFLLIN